MHAFPVDSQTRITSFAWLLGLREIAVLTVPVGEHSVTLKIIDSGGKAAKDWAPILILVLDSLSPGKGDILGGQMITLAGVGFDFTANDIVVRLESASLSCPRQISILDNNNEGVGSFSGSVVEVQVQKPIGISNTQAKTYVADVPIRFESGDVHNPTRPTRVRRCVQPDETDQSRL
jgi:hypothetical protein